MAETGPAEEDQDGLAAIVLRAPMMAGRASTWICGQQLRELRQARGLTQKKLAALASVSYATLSRLEGKPATSCREQTAARLAAALGALPAALAPRPGSARAAAAAPAIATLAAALATSGANATITATPAGTRVTAAVTPANVMALLDALVLALNIVGETVP